jgi:LCP family protein required for cell wall assembly
MLLIVTVGWLRRHRKLLAWTGGGVSMLLVALAATGYLAYRHLSSNIAQANVRADIGKQPADLHPQAQNILIVGSGSAQATTAGAAGVSNQTGTLLLVHIAADKQWADIMSIPPYSWVSIPSCTTPGGQLSAPLQSKVNQAYATGDQDGNHVALGAACMIKALGQDTGIYINHFVVMNVNGFDGMVAALGGVEECNLTPIDDPAAGLVLPPGRHLLTPAQAVTYVHGLFGPESSSNVARITLQEALGVSLINRAKSKLPNPLAAYQFLDALTTSLTVDSQLGGMNGLYYLAHLLHGIPADKVTLFALPSHPRADVVPSDTTDVLWTQPVDNEIFASFRNDAQVSRALLAAGGRPGRFGVLPSAPPGTSRDVPVRTADLSICVD